VYVIRDYLCRPRAQVDTGTVRAGDDAVEVRWFAVEELSALDTAPGLVDALTGWGIVRLLVDRSGSRG
jgi:hypothetical protein